jgi:hypothetical protein
MSKVVWQGNPSFKELVWCERALHPDLVLAFVQDGDGNRAVLKVYGRSWEILGTRLNRVLCRGDVGVMGDHLRARLMAYRSWRISVERGLFAIRDAEEGRALIRQLNDEEQKRRSKMDMDFGNVFAAVDEGKNFLCEPCADEEGIDLGSPHVNTWEVGSGGWTGPVMCKACKRSIPVVCDGEESE